MLFQPTNLADAYLIQLETITDDRGFLLVPGVSRNLLRMGWIRR